MLRIFVNLVAALKSSYIYNKPYNVLYFRQTCAQNVQNCNAFSAVLSVRLKHEIIVHQLKNDKLRNEVNVLSVFNGQLLVSSWFHSELYIYNDSTHVTTLNVPKTDVGIGDAKWTHRGNIVTKSFDDNS